MILIAGTGWRTGKLPGSSAWSNDLRYCTYRLLWRGEEDTNKIKLVLGVSRKSVDRGFLGGEMSTVWLWRLSFELTLRYENAGVIEGVLICGVE